MTAPDTMANPLHSTLASNRPTPDAMGGGAVEAPERSRAAAVALEQHRREPSIDERLSAAVGRWWEERKAKHYKLNGSAVAVAGAVTVIDLGGPKQGFTWALRRINVGPADYAAGAGSYPVAITTIVAMTTRQPGVNYPANAAQQVIDQTGAFPVSGTWGRGQATVAEGDRLFVLVVGLDDGYQLTAGGEVEETAAGVPEIYGL